MTKVPGFFGTFFSLCRGTADAPLFVRNPFWKVLLQFLLLSVLVAFFVAVGRSFVTRGEFEEAENKFIGAFGPEIAVHGRSILPVREENVARELSLPNDGKLYYTGTATQNDRIIKVLGGVRYLIFWHHGNIFCAIRAGQDQWQIIRPGEKQMIVSVSGDRNVLKALLQDAEPQPAKNIASPERLEVSTIVSFIRITHGIGVFLQQLVTAFFYGLVTTGIATLVFSIGNRRMLRGIMLWKSAIYAGFPAMVIAGFFPMLDLPVFSYTQVYLFSMLIYWIFLSRRIEFALQQENTTDSQGGF